MKKNDFEEAEYVDCVESYLGGKAKQWYIIYQDKFKDWAKCKESFLKQFKSKERELASWEELQGFKQESIDILETASKLQVLFKAASITEEKDKLRYLTACLKPSFKKLIFEKGAESWEEAINQLVRYEQLESICNESPSGSGGNLFENVTKEKLIQEARSLKNDPEVMYEKIVKKFDELSINIINSIKAGNSRPPPKNPFCFECREPGHWPYQCPRRETNPRTNTSVATGSNAIPLNTNKREVNFLEVENEVIVSQVLECEAGETEVYAAEKRKNELQKEKDVKRRREGESTIEVKSNRDIIKPKIQRKKGIPIKFTTDKDEYSIKKELQGIQANINLAQLLEASPQVRKELITYIRKGEEYEIKEVNSIENVSSNCKVIISIFGRHYWAILDTGAACSVISNTFAEVLGLDIDKESNQIIVTADGRKHGTKGIISEVPLTIAGQRFPVDMTVMDQRTHVLILGTNWFKRHGAVINLNSNELVLNNEEYEISLSISTRKDITIESKDNEYELYCHDPFMTLLLFLICY
ncbi:DNA damage-inducible protein 1 [Zancudomyces culisetae]|uniref:DNA damage-inducible protein 1 n=1 Tax=Zancudomyces culisetae TaxID=1213189 RepID=A0A1R1PDT6_ZANCU|nr:DNA damage-inducible protein 1 [Zancudomyces culisetae]|eukprot:OMH79032.1 DNA damage-inducible protein 1 [Zancudomyces culisetae]